MKPEYSKVLRGAIIAASIISSSASVLAAESSTLQMFRCKGGGVSLIFADPDGRPHPHLDAGNNVDRRNYLIVGEEGKLFTVEVGDGNDTGGASVFYGDIDDGLGFDGSTLYVKIDKSKPNTILLRIWRYSFESANLDQDSVCDAASR